MARLIKVSYAGLTVGLGGNSSIVLTDRYRFGTSYTEASVTFECLVWNSNRTSFLSAEAALIAAFRTPDGDLDVDLGGSDRHSYSHSLNTGTNARASCEKLGTEQDTANSARYRCSVTVQLPADLSARAGRQTSSVSVDATPAGKFTVTIEGTYTALADSGSGASSAVESYEDAIDGYCTTVLGDFTGKTFNLLTPTSYVRDDQNKAVRFKRVYEQVFYRESTSLADVASIKGQKLTIERAQRGPAGDPTANAQPFDVIRAEFFCWVDSSVTTDLRSLYETTISGHIFDEIGLVGQAGIVILSESPSFNLAEGSISSVVEAAVIRSGLLFATLDVEDQIDHGRVLRQVWDKDPYAVDLYDVPKLWIRVYRRTTLSAGSGDLPIPQPRGFLELTRARSVTRNLIGSVGRRGQLPTVLGVDTFVFRRANVLRNANLNDPGPIPPPVTNVTTISAVPS